jgi:hypothetical protein
MSVNWKYVADKIIKNVNTKNTNIISILEMTEKLQGNINPPIYKWTIRLENGHLMDLYNKDINHIRNLTKEDERALYEAWENDKELKKKGYEEIKTKLF